MDRKCDSIGCPKDARWQIAFRVWPAGVKLRTQATCMEGISGACVCDEHAVRDPEKFFTSKAKERIAVVFLQGGRGMPDFTTAQIIHTEVVDGEPLTREEATSLQGLPEMMNGQA